MGVTLYGVKNKFVSGNISNCKGYGIMGYNYIVSKSIFNNNVVGIYIEGVSCEIYNNVITKGSYGIKDYGGNILRLNIIVFLMLK